MMNSEESKLKKSYRNKALGFCSCGVTLFGSSIYAGISTTSLLFQFFSVLGILLGFGLIGHGIKLWRESKKPNWLLEKEELIGKR